MHIGTINLDHKTSSTRIIMDAIMSLYERIMNKNLLARKIYITANDVINEELAKKEKKFEQIDFFTNYHEKEIKKQEEQNEKELQKTIIKIKNKYGKNAIIKGMNLQKEGTTIQRNGQIGGHKG